jgi:hypothetical protein
MFSLYHRFTTQGTLSDPDEVPDPRFALPSTVNWMRALAILVQDRGLNFASASTFYSGVQKRVATVREENTVFEQLLFAVHQLSALEALRTSTSKADVARVGIVGWYYGVYSAASAMIAAQDGSIQDDHTGTATTWDRQFVSNNKVMEPFCYRLSTLVKKDFDVEVATLRAGNGFLLTEKATDATEAFGACCSYLSGSADWWKWKAEQNLKSSREFKALNVSDFRTKAARSLRDARLAGKSTAFLHQAFRYRGKANYREALFLGYGKATETLLDGYTDDLAIVLRGFVAMAGAFVAKRIGQPLWDEFLDDLERNRAFELSPMTVWA